MGERRFDDLTKAIAANPSRRGVIRGFLGGVVGGLAAFAGRGEGLAAKKCKNGESQCGKKCCKDSKASCCGGKQCCKKGRDCCKTPGGKAKCCGRHQRCVDGRCTPKGSV